MCVMAHLMSLGYQPEVARRACDTCRAEIARGEGWLILTRGHDLTAGADDLIRQGGALVLTRREDVSAVLARLIDAGLDACEAVLVDLRRLRQKAELGLTHYLSARRGRGRPRKPKKEDDQ